MSEIPFRRPVVIAGGLHPRQRGGAREFIRALNAPVYAEPLSGLREHADLRDLLITAGDRMIARGRFDGVVRIGNVPTLRFWRDLDESMKNLPVLNFSESRFAGLSRGDVQPIHLLPEVSARARDEAFFETDRELAAKLARILDDEPMSELALLRDFSGRLPASARVYLGNSLPIREWDLVATRDGAFEYEANRGANGIDGQLSTFFGWCVAGGYNVAVLGDLTTLYDMNAPWIVHQLDAAIDFTIVIINNGGGRIFSRVPSLRKVDRRLMANEHDVSFERWAAMWGLAYNDQSAPRSVIELKPDRAASDRVWMRYDELWS
jgi:2-succinyl-5-enolpyruvyl-6-hydroxy-3-cyclohexene-1-carboxylate synthase